MATPPQLAALVQDLGTKNDSNTSSSDNESICEALTPRKVTLIEREEIHEKVRRPFILSGYLDLTHIESHSISLLSSLFSFHNETANIYTHLIPGILILIYLSTQWIELGTFFWIDYNEMCIEPSFYEPYGIFIIDDVFYSFWNTRSFILHLLMLCLFTMCLLSSYYHCGRCIDPSKHDFYLSIDWFGVMTLIFSSFLSCIYVGFECYPTIKMIYFIIVFGTIFFILIPMFFVWPNLTNFKCKAISLALFGAFGAIVIPFHWLYFLATDDEYDIFLSVSIKFFMLYTFGFICFIFRLPERIFPGHLDMIGNSHNIWHICIVFGSWLWWKGLNNVAQHRLHC